MDILKQFNLAISYVEDNLYSEIDLEAVAQIACVARDSFVRFFSYITGMTLTEYIRRRRLSAAVYDLQRGEKVIDVATKLGWNSADAFTKAFIRQHGINPKAARNPKASVQIYPPASFYIMIKGARKMDFRIVELEETKVYGIRKRFEGENYKNREELRSRMWSEDSDNIPAQISKGSWNEPGNKSYDGIWYGVWKDGSYAIAREEKDISKSGLEKQIISAGTYAAFKTKPGTLAWEEFPRLFELALESWLPNSEYAMRDDNIIEIYHMWTDKELRNKNRYYELLIPVEKKSGN